MKLADYRRTIIGPWPAESKIIFIGIGGGCENQNGSLAEDVCRTIRRDTLNIYTDAGTNIMKDALRETAG